MLWTLKRRQFPESWRNLRLRCFCWADRGNLHIGRCELESLLSCWQAFTTFQRVQEPHHSANIHLANDSKSSKVNPRPSDYTRKEQFAQIITFDTKKKRFLKSVCRSKLEFSTLNHFDLLGPRQAWKCVFMKSELNVKTGQMCKANSALIMREKIKRRRSICHDNSILIRRLIYERIPLDRQLPRAVLFNGVRIESSAKRSFIFIIGGSRIMFYTSLRKRPSSLSATFDRSLWWEEPRKILKQTVSPRERDT